MQNAELTQGVPSSLRPRICSALQGWYDVSHKHRPPLSQEKSLVLIFKDRIDPRAHGSVGGSHGKNFQ